MSIFNLDKKPNQLSTDRALAYATRADFQRIFTEDMGTLHLLALLLTADARKAEECFVAGLDDIIKGNPVFREWARSWSKRVIIRNAIKLVSPVPGEREQTANPGGSRRASERDAWTATILHLPAFERFVFVILVLEGHSESDAASLLGCGMHELIQARSRALSQIAATRPGLEAARGAGVSIAPIDRFA